MKMYPGLGCPRGRAVAYRPRSPPRRRGRPCASQVLKGVVCVVEDIGDDAADMHRDCSGFTGAVGR